MFAVEGVFFMIYKVYESVQVAKMESGLSQTHGLRLAFANCYAASPRTVPSQSDVGTNTGNNKVRRVLIAAALTKAADGIRFETRIRAVHPAFSLRYVETYDFD